MPTTYHMLHSENKIYLVRSVNLCAPVYKYLNYLKIAFLGSYYEGVLMRRSALNIVKSVTRYIDITV